MPRPGRVDRKGKRDLRTPLRVLGDRVGTWSPNPWKPRERAEEQASAFMGWGHLAPVDLPLLAF